MFEIFKKEIKIADKVKLYLTSGKEVEVDIIEIGDKGILVKNSDGTQSRFFEQLIGGWDLIIRPTINQELEKSKIESPITSSESTQNENPNRERKIGLTIVGKIDLDKIQPKRKVIKEINPNISPPQPKTLSQHIREHNLVFTSLENLQQLKDKITSDIAKQTIPANAIIKRFGQNSYGSRFGFLTDNEKRDYYFSLSDVYDEKLKEILSKPNPQGTHVICSLKSIQGKLKATSVYLPKTVQEFQSVAESFYKSKDFIESLSVLNFITNSVSDFEPALNLKNQILEEQSSKKVTSISALSIYFQARSALKRGNIEYAKKLLLELIEKANPKSETALKELSYELQREGKLEDAIQLVSKYQNLIQTSDPNSLLAYFYETKKDYVNAISYLEKVKPQTPIEKIKVDKRLAVSYFQTKDYTKSEFYLKKVLEKQPNDSVSQKLLDALGKIKSDGLSEEIESIFNEAELNSLSGGLSPFMLFELNRCDYYGVQSSEATRETFSKRTLNELKKLIDALKDGRPKERAELYLSEAKVQRVINSEEEKSIKSSLAKFCTSVSLSWSADNRNNDTFRFYILEACSLNPEFGVISPYIPMYLHSFFYQSFETRTKSSQPLKALVEEIFSKELNDKFWTGMIDLILVNTEFTSKFLSYIFPDKYKKEKAIKFLSGYLGEEFSGINSSKDYFLQIWNKASNQRKRQKDILNAKYIALNKSNTTESFIEAFNSLSSSIPDWCSNLDKARINSLFEITKTIVEFNSQNAFEDKERYFNISLSQINSLESEIIESPTEFSFNILRQQLTILSKLIEREFKNVIQTSKPVINIKVLGESIIHDNNLVIASINVSNKKGSAPISWFLININDSEGIQFVQENNESNQSLKGGDDKTLKLKAQVSNSIREQGAFNLNVKFSYKVRGSEEIMAFNENLAIRLYSESEFDEIPNPFAATADSGPVQDEKMFYGRTEFIDNIKNSILESSSKCVIIYGQKRSGKSSVLFHLKKQLNQSAQAFCISFSLGEIVEDLSSQTFYYKILSEIEDSLESISLDGRSKPKFTSPPLAELKDAPSLIFNDYMRRFKKECQSISGWENTKLVLLIDEFTYIYTAIQKEFLSDQFMKTWKSFVEKSFFTSILIGQDIMPKFKMAYQNEFGIAEDKRLSYLSKEDAIKLIEEPIWDVKRKRSRYLGKAMDLILDYTSSNPYYIQIFCARLVEYMNSQKVISVTEADVYDVAQTFIKGEQSLSPDKFDNLITAGDADIEAFNPQDILKALKEIAIASKNLDSCSRDSIKLGDRDKEEQILSDLKTREVISCPQSGFYKIKVRLFKEWLLNN
jgi:hypothetical protein